MPRFWTGSQLACLNGSFAGESYLRHRRYMQALYDLSGTNIPWEHFLWAMSVLSSRAFNIGSSRSRVHTALIPFADLLNEGAPSDVEWSVDGKARAVKFVSKRLVRKGSEVTNSYGPHPNHKLLQSYGFTYPEVPFADMSDQDLFAGSIALSLEKSQRFIIIPEMEEKSKLMSQKYEPVFRFKRFVDGEAFWKLLQYARFLSLPGMGAEFDQAK